MPDSISSPPSSAAQDAAASKLPVSSPPANSLAFLVHSPDTVQRNLPPDVDNKPLARQKRRRTSKEDEDILKAEYRRNPKPDKAARMEIVKRVALGEKEVQIWFQNKRQNDRRRSKPAQAYDLYPSHPSSETGNTIATASHTSPHDPQSSSDRSSGTESHPAPPVAPRPDAHAEDAPARAAAGPDRTTDTPSAMPNSQPGSNVSSQETAVTDFASSQPKLSSQDGESSLRPGYLANRRSASFKILEDGYADAKPSNGTAETPEQSSRPLRRARSFVRLSMTADGKAKVVTDADQSPSPPRSQPQRRFTAAKTVGLRRSYSAAGLTDRFAQAATGMEPARKMARTSSTSIGRSRDSRAWEFWCDSEARNSLAEKADQEGSGSAADAISLIRTHSRGSGGSSSSTSGALRPNPSKRNLPLTRHSSATAGSKTDAIKPARRSGFGRAATTQGLMPMLMSTPLPPRTPGLTKPSPATATARRRHHQGTPTDDLTKHHDKVLGEDAFETLPPTESDKENWEPDHHIASLFETPASGSIRRRRHAPAPPCSQAQVQSLPRPAVLGEHADVPRNKKRRGLFSSPRRVVRRQDAEEERSDMEREEDPEEDEEVAAFMRAGQEGVRTSAAMTTANTTPRASVSSGEEMGCVEGLLALSQGNWGVAR